MENRDGERNTSWIDSSNCQLRIVLPSVSPFFVEYYTPQQLVYTNRKSVDSNKPHATLRARTSRNTDTYACGLWSAEYEHVHTPPQL